MDRYTDENVLSAKAFNETKISRKRECDLNSNETSSQAIKYNVDFDKSMANTSYFTIKEHIISFEESLDDEHEVAFKLTSFGQSITMTVTSISYSNPSTLVFIGTIGADRAVLLQHMSQLNFLLLAQVREDKSKPKFKIGFNY